MAELEDELAGAPLPAPAKPLAFFEPVTLAAIELLALASVFETLPIAGSTTFTLFPCDGILEPWAEDAAVVDGADEAAGSAWRTPPEVDDEEASPGAASAKWVRAPVPPSPPGCSLESEVEF